MDFDSFSDDLFNAYLAGFTDGEGYIAYKPGMGVRITLANCVMDVLVAIQRRLGYGHLKSQQQKPHWRRRWVLDVANMREASDFLKRIRPYLLIKAAVADTVLAHIAEKTAYHESIAARNQEIRERAASGEMRKKIAQLEKEIEEVKESIKKFEE